MGKFQGLFKGALDADCMDAKKNKELEPVTGSGKAKRKRPEDDDYYAPKFGDAGYDRYRVTCKNLKSKLVSSIEVWGSPMSEEQAKIRALKSMKDNVLKSPWEVTGIQRLSSSMDAGNE